MRKAKQSKAKCYTSIGIEKLCETTVKKMVELPLTWNKFHSSDTLGERKK